MPAENALVFLRRIEGAKTLPRSIVVAGPQAFLREYILDAIARRLGREGFAYRSLAVPNATDAARVADELKGSELFAAKRVIACRLARTTRERVQGDDADGEGGREGSGTIDGMLSELIRENQGPNHLVIVCDRDTAPAKIRRAAESAGVVVNCLRPFDNQLPQYAELFARRLGLKLSPAVAELTVSRHGADLAAVANALAKAAIHLEPAAQLGPDDVSEPGTARMPELFEIAEALSAGHPALALGQLSRAVAYGREPVEILSVEIVPAIRRMMIAASMLAARKSSAEIAAALGFSPASTLAARAIEGAKRLGLERLGRVYQRATELDAGFKGGQIRNRAQALEALILELEAP